MFFLAVLGPAEPLGRPLVTFPGPGSGRPRLGGRMSGIFGHWPDTKQRRPRSVLLTHRYSRWQFATVERKWSWSARNPGLGPPHPTSRNVLIARRDSGGTTAPRGIDIIAVGAADYESGGQEFECAK